MSSVPPHAGRLLAFGDVHGCTMQLDALWATVKPTPADTVVFLGDYVDRGPDSKGAVEPLVAASLPDGTMGYNAIIVVRTDSPYKTIEDLKGKVVARTDPLSGSGYLIPTAAFRAMGKPVDEYYKSPLSGGHVQSVLGEIGRAHV